MRRMFIAPLLILGTLASVPALAADAEETPAAQPPARNREARQQAVHQAVQQAAEQAASQNGANNGDKAPAASPSSNPAPTQGKGAAAPHRTTKPIYGDIIIHKR